MGVIARLRQAVMSLLPEQTPAQEIESALDELRKHQAAAVQELVAYKTYEKDAGQRAEALEARATELHKKAELAVRAGNDELAKEALLAAQEARSQATTLSAERIAASREAKQLLEARRQLQQRITAFELKKGTLAGQLAEGRGQGVMKAEGKHWDALERAEQRIAEADALAELDGEAMIPESSRLDGQLKEAQADHALAELKARTAKQLPKKTGE